MKRRCTMRTYVGVDYHRKYSYLTMDDRGQVLREGPVENRKEAVAEFLARDDGEGDVAPANETIYKESFLG
jgi:hypothetical protein